MATINFTCPYCTLNMCSLKQSIENYVDRQPLEIQCAECCGEYTLILKGCEQEVADFLGVEVGKPSLSIPSVMPHRDFAFYLDGVADDLLPDSVTGMYIRDAARRIRQLAVRPATVRSMIKTIQMDLNTLRGLMDE